jgi:hypothetical protein
VWRLTVSGHAELMQQPAPVGGGGW